MLARVAVVISLCAAALAQGPKIYQPDATHWWVADSLANIAWDCNDKSHDQFTVLVSNPTNSKLLVSPLAIIAQQFNYDCSKAFTPTGLGAGTGYIVQFANILNSTDVYSQSDPFEIKPKGSAYPTDTPTAPGGGGSPTGTGSGSSPTTTGKGAANSIKPQWAMGLALGAVGVAFGL